MESTTTGKQLHRRNSALEVDDFGPSAAAIAITSHGSDAYFSIMCVMGTVGLGVIAASMMKPRMLKV